MKNRIIKASLLVFLTSAVLWLTETILTQTMKRCKEETIGKINAVMAHDLDVQLTIWGASTAYFNINPSIIMDSLKISAMNMGINGANIDQYAGLLNEYIEYTTQSDYLIIALDLHGGLMNRQSLFELHNWLHQANNPKIYQCFSDIDPDLMLKYRYVPFYSLILYDKHMFPYFRRTLLSQGHQYQVSNHGYSPNGHGTFCPTKPYEFFETKIDQRCIDKIRKATRAANLKGIKCYVVVTPCYQKGLDHITNRADFKAQLNSLKADQTQVLDFSDGYISKQPAYFKDNTHLNSDGADELTRLLISEMKGLTP